MKKIGIITFHESINYGAILQTFALQEILRRQGYDVEAIDYKNPKRGLVHLSKFNKLKHYLWHFFIKGLITGQERKNRTIKFIKSNIKISKETYNCKKKLKEKPPIYDYYITGSDQVWNPKNTSNDGSYFLDFVPKNKLKISYAPSFGVTLLKEELKEEYIERIDNIDKLSIREDEGKEIIKKINGREAKVVLDPTLLMTLNEWKEFSVPYVNKKPYVLCYHMPGFKKVNKKIDEIAYKIAKEKNWDVVHVGEKEFKRLIPGKKRIFNAGPSEYVGLFENAQFIVTNSFHGTAFSINFNKPFYVPIDKKLPKEKVLSSRISSLLKKLELDSRLLGLEEKVDLIEAFKVDYRKANEKLESEKIISMKFLKNALEEGK